MKKRKWKERVFAGFMAGVVATGSMFAGGPIVMNMNTTVKAMSFKDDPWAQYADENGFAIRNGVLYGYFGEATDLVIPEEVKKIAGLAFWGNKTIESVTINENVTEIGRGAFQDVTSLKKVIINADLQEIPNTCFDGCSALTDVQLNENLERIGVFAFNDCKSLSTIKIPETVKELDNYAFRACPIEKVDLPKGLLVYGSGVFSSLEELDLPAGIKQITSLMVGSSSETLEKVTLHEGLEEIGQYAFGSAKNLKTITFPSNLQKIGEMSFYQCDSLESIEIPDAELILDSFHGCKNLKSVTLGAGVKRLEKSFQGCESLKELHMEPGLESIGDCTFASTALEKVEIPSTVTYIGNDAFQTKGITDVVLPNSSLQYVASDAFTYTTWYKNLEKQVEQEGGIYIYVGNVLLGVTSNVWSGENGAITTKEPTATDDAKLPTLTPTATEEGEDPEEEPTAKPEVTDEETTAKPEVTDEEPTATPWDWEEEPTETPWDWEEDFAEDDPWYLEDESTDAPTETKLPAATPAYQKKSLKKQALNGETSNQFVLPENISVIADVTTKMEKVVVADGIAGISRLYGTNLKEVTLPDSVAYLGKNIFNSSSKLEKITLSENLTTIPERAFYDCKALKEITVPKHVGTIGERAFSRCTALTSVTLPEGLETISCNAFEQCSALKEITIPASVTTIGQDAFSEVAASFVIKGYSGSAAEVYAKENNITFQSVGTVAAEPTEEPKATEVPVITMAPTEQPIVTETPNSTEATEVPVETEKPGETYTVTLDANGGVTQYNQITVQNNTEYQNLPAASKDGCQFVGWYTDLEEGTLVTNTTVANLSSDQTLYARWESETSTLCFEGGDGGYVDSEQKKKTIMTGETYGELPEPSPMTNNTFLGWYTQKEGGTQITSDMVVNGIGETTAYAHWATTENYTAPQLEALSYKFGNSASDFEYSAGYKIPYSIYSFIFGEKQSTLNMFSGAAAWGGSCFGMTASSLFLNADEDDVDLKEFNSSATKPSQLSVTDNSKKHGMTLKELIESLHVTQNSSEVGAQLWGTKDQISDLCDKVTAAQNKKAYPVIICIFGQEGGHAVIGYKYDQSAGKLYVYDPNYPNTERYITISSDKTSWSYKMNDTFDWGTGKPNAMISYVDYETFLEVWNKRDSECYSSKNMVNLNVSNAEIYNADNVKVATITDGMMESDTKEIYQLLETAGEEEREGCTFFITQGTFTVKNTDAAQSELVVKTSGTDRKNELTTKSDMVTISIDDSKNINELSVTPKSGEAYSIVMESQDTKNEGKVTVSGNAKGTDPIVASQTKQGVAFENTDGATVKVDDQAVSLVNVVAEVKEDTNKAENGSVTRQGDKNIIQGKDAVYAITPDNGYMIDEVKVDGRSYGNISAYTFSKISAQHKIEASFTEASFEKASARVMDAGMTQGVVPNLLIKIGKQTLSAGDDYEATIDTAKSNATTMTLKVQGKNYYKRTSMVIEVNMSTRAVAQKSYEVDDNTQATVEDPNLKPQTTEDAVASDATPVPTATSEPKATASPAPSALASASPAANLTGDKNTNTNGNGENKNNSQDTFSKGEVYTKGAFVYTVIDVANKKVEVSGAVKTGSQMTIPAKVTLDGVSFKVTKIGNGAWKSDTSLKGITIGANVTSIGAKAFAGAKNLKKIVFKGKNVTSIGSAAFKGISSKAVIKVPAGTKAKYKKLCKGKGQKSSVKIK